MSIGWRTADAHSNGDCGSFCPICDIEDAIEEARIFERVHNHPPYRPMCNERRLPSGQLRGACLNDDGTDCEEPRNPPGVSSDGGDRP